VTTASVGAVTLWYGLTFGLPGAAVGAALVALLAWRVRPLLRIGRAARFIVADRLDEAEVVLRSLAGRGPRRSRALIAQLLGEVAVRRGDHAAALEHQRQALALYATGLRRQVAARALEYSEIATLVSLGRAGEARQIFAGRHRAVPKGDYLRVAHWTAELYLCLAEGKHDIGADDLHERARVGLRVPLATGLLGLTAWAHAQMGHTDQAWHLLRETYERLPEANQAQRLPLLIAWMDAHRAEAEAAADADR
jgi:hypothetical protein